MSVLSSKYCIIIHNVDIWDRVILDSFWPVYSRWIWFQLIYDAMTRRCSHCTHIGHNSRTCPNRGVKLFGVRLTDGSIRKSASMGNLTHYLGSNQPGSSNPGSPGDTSNNAAPDGYASEDCVPGSSSTSRERKKGKLLFFIFKKKRSLTIYYSWTCMQSFRLLFLKFNFTLVLGYVMSVAK